MKRTGLYMVAALAALGGCEDDVNVKGANAKGSVGGLVYDAASRTPLEGIEVSVLAGRKVFGPEPTGADGSFRFKKVPAGEVLIMISGTDTYNGAWINEEVPRDTGEFPSGNVSVTAGPIGLVPMTRSFEVRVLDNQGAPVPNYPVTIQTFPQWVDLSTGTAESVGEIVTTATTDGSGYARYDAFPDHFGMGPEVVDAGVVLLPPLDADGDGVLEFGGGDRLFNFRSLTDPTPDVVLDAGFTVDLQVRASTISSLSFGGTNPVAPVISNNDPVHVSFNLPIRDDVEVILTDEDGAPVERPSPVISDDTLTIPFDSTPTLLAASEYNIQIHAVARVGDRLVSGDFAGAFFTRSLENQVTVVNATRDPATQLVTLEFSEPIGLGNPGSQSTLSGQNCVLFFAHDLDGSGSIGDAANELTSPACSVVLQSAEPDPPGLPGLSGYSRLWQFTAPTDSVGNPLPPSTPVHVLFSRVPTEASRVERADGRPVPDFTASAAIPLP